MTQIAAQTADVEWGRRIEHQLGRAFPAPQAVGFPNPDLGRRRSRLAVHLYDLEPYYDLNDTMMGVCGPSTAIQPTPPKPHRANAATVARPCAALARHRPSTPLGWHWWPADAAIYATATYGGREAVQQLPGPCLHRLRAQAKASAT